MVSNRAVIRLPAALLLASLGACSTTPDRLEFSMPTISPTNEAQSRTWPPPPEVPRYMYIGDLRGESNKLDNPEQRRSPLARFFAALVGLDSDSVPLTNLLRPQQVVSDDQGRIYVADPGRQAVFVFDERNSHFSMWNENSLGIPLLSPVGLAVHDGRVFISDSEQGVVLVLDNQGEFLYRIGDNSLKRPTGIAVDTERRELIVSDTDASEIRLFDLDGTPKQSIGSPGSAVGQFNRPTFVHYHANRVYVTDSLNARLQVIDRTDGSAITIGKRGLYVGNFARPKGIAVDFDGNIYVTESYYDFVLIFNPQGELLFAFGGSGDEPGEFSQPTGIWVDSMGRLFVSDMLNGRISIFQYLGEG